MIPYPDKKAWKSSNPDIESSGYPNMPFHVSIFGNPETGVPLYYSRPKDKSENSVTDRTQLRLPLDLTLNYT